MRAFAIAAVMTSLVAGAGYVLAPAPRVASAPTPGFDGQAPGASDAALDASSVADSEVAPQSDAANPRASVRTYYQWTDEGGAVRFAQSLDAVPAQWRERAGKIEVDAGSYLPRSARTAAGKRSSSPAAIADEPRRALHDVTVYTAPWCGWCRKTLAFLDERGVDYVNKDIEKDEEYAAELQEKTGGRSIPVVEIDGSMIRGYSPHEMATLLE
jgi:glutaredoxin